MTGELITLTGRGYIKCIGHTGLDDDPNDWKLMQLEALLPLFMRNELSILFHQKIKGTGLFYKPSVWFGKDGKRVNPIAESGHTSLWNSSVIHREQDYNSLIDNGVHPQQAALLLPQLLEYVTVVSEPIRLDTLITVMKNTESYSPDSQVVARAVSSFVKELWPQTVEKEIF